MIDSPDLSELWIVVEGSPDRAYLLGNSHTSPGRMYACWTDEGDGFSISKNEIVDASNLAKVWIDGFLAGNEPTLSEFLGVSNELASSLLDDDPAVDRWRKSLKRFRVSGTASPQVCRPSVPFPDVFVPIERPWIAAGEEIFVWTRGENWKPADPQPTELPDNWNFKSGSICEEEAQHEADFVEPSHLYCTRCGFTEEVEIDDEADISLG